MGDFRSDNLEENGRNNPYGMKRTSHRTSPAFADLPGEAVMRVLMLSRKVSQQKYRGALSLK